MSEAKSDLTPKQRMSPRGGKSVGVAPNMKTPPASILIKKAAKVDKGSGVPHTEKVGKITRAQAEEIAKTKQPDLTAADMDAANRTMYGSARRMGIEVEGQ